MSDWAVALQRDFDAEVTRISACSGGDINAAWDVEFADGRRLFVKSSDGHPLPDGMYAAEARGLELLRRAAGPTLDVPEVMGVGQSYLALEWRDLTGAPNDFEEVLGRGLALMHRSSAEAESGFDRLTFLGRWPQRNEWLAEPVEFWRRRRLQPMLESLIAYREVQRKGFDLLDDLDRLLEGTEKGACLLHGDLWSGNAAWSTAGRPCLFDPACYFGCREIEFGMTRLFGFGPRFEDAYQEIWPLAEGWERRVEVYRLHHLMSHLWHFGGSYQPRCLALLSKLLS